MTDLSRDIPKKPATAEHINDNRLPQVNDFYQAITYAALKKRTKAINPPRIRPTTAPRNKISALFGLIGLSGPQRCLPADKQKYSQNRHSTYGRGCIASAAIANPI